MAEIGNNMGNTLRKNLKLAAGKIIYAFGRPFASCKVDMSDETANKVLEGYWPRPIGGGNCIAKNEVMANSQYDLQIIVPCYNVEKYVEQCVDSILGQKTKYSFYLILVNDGSKDKTGEIIKKYENMPNVEIITQKNAGLSSARNRALRRINARYVMFVDSDDYILPGAIEALISAADRNGASIVQGGCYNLEGDNLSINVSYKDGFHPIDEVKGLACIKIYKAEIFDNIRFPEGLWFEDTINLFLAYWKAKRIYCISDMIYVYRQVVASISHRAMGSKKALDTYYVTELIMKDARDLGFDFNSEYLNIYLIQVLCNCLRLFEAPKEVQVAVFVKQAKMLDWFNEDARPTKEAKGLWASLKCLDFGRYSLFCKTHRKL